ncbi:GNAT family N-acetyltransferase [Cohnella cholangitidis]|uniref:GNAT family N-acetyltransferase n=1 Tax=Cohnella cholangitidis TaxID=2598458 RepID=A0A7G5C652_9BACL|nr:GNAT family protein [Cohnella cholangitidis]QMV44686.1 GNAT family N-acetyltransferase [Cohnella cholangitidis]
MPRLQGNLVMLREYRRDDLPWMRQWVNDPDIVHHLSDIFLYPHALESTEAYLESMLDGRSDSRGFVIADPSTEAYIGQVNLDSIDWKNRVGKIGIVIGSTENLGRGYGTEAMKLLIDFAFLEMNLNRLELEVYDFNERAVRSYLKCGFTEEGRLRERLYKQGRYLDVIQMGILKSDWKASRGTEQPHG